MKMFFKSALLLCVCLTVGSCNLKKEKEYHSEFIEIDESNCTVHFMKIPGIKGTDSIRIALFNIHGIDYKRYESYELYEAKITDDYVVSWVNASKDVAEHQKEFFELYGKRGICFWSVFSNHIFTEEEIIQLDGKPQTPHSKAPVPNLMIHIKYFK